MKNATNNNKTNTTAAIYNGIPYAHTIPTGEELAHIGDIAAGTAIRAKHEKSGLFFLDWLQWQAYNDNRRANLPTIAAEAMEARATHAAHRAAAEDYQRIADRISTPAKQAEAAAIMARFEREAAAHALTHAEGLEKVISTTSHSDRADIVQAAAVAYWDYITDPDHAAEEQDEAGRAAFRAACKAAGRAISAVAAAHGCTAHRTKVAPISEEAARAWQEAHANAEKVPFSVREGMAAGYITMEYRNTPKFPAGWYMVKHYRTEAPCISYETFATGEEYAAAEGVTPYTTNGGINAITDSGDAERINALFDRANLSERERLLCRYMADNTAAAAGIRAVAAHQAETAARMEAAPTREAAQRIRREADKRTEKVRAAAQRENALHRAGIYSDRTGREILRRIREKLTAAQ